jgi:hypothetical protein
MTVDLMFKGDDAVLPYKVAAQTNATSDCRRKTLCLTITTHRSDPI